MTAPFRLRVLQALTAALNDINPDNGYASDLRQKVFRGRLIFGHDDPLPMVAILEAIEQEQARIADMPSGTGMVKRPFELMIQGFVDDDPDNPCDPAYYLKAEVEKRLVQERIRERQRNILGMGGRVTDLKLSPGVVRPPDDVSGKAYFWLRMTLEIVEDLSDPYA